MAKNAQVFIQWDTKDRWNGVKQYVKRKDVKPYEESLRCGQEVKLKWASRWYKVIMCEDWSPKKRKSKKILYNLTYFLIQKLLTLEINVLRISRIISVLNSTASSDSSTEAVVTDEDIPLSAHVLRMAKLVSIKISCKSRAACKKVGTSREEKELPQEIQHLSSQHRRAIPNKSNPCLANENQYHG